MSDKLLPPNEETTGLGTYTWWVWTRWLVVFSSGGVGLVVLIWGLMGFTITNLLYLIPIYSLFFIIQVYVATYKLWEAERRDKLSIIETVNNQTSQIEKLSFEKDNFEQESRELQLTLLQQEKDRKPNLIGSAKDIRIYPVVDITGKILGTRISIYVGVTNASTVPTTISNFILDVASTDGDHFLGYAGYEPSRFGIPYFQQQECMISQGALSDNNQRLADHFSNGQKAELGVRHEGWLFFDFEMIQNPDENFDWSNNLKLKVVDAFDEKHQIDGGVLKKYNEID